MVRLSDKLEYILENLELYLREGKAPLDALENTIEDYIYVFLTDDGKTPLARAASAVLRRPEEPKSSVRRLSRRCHEIAPEWEWFSQVDNTFFTLDQQLLKCRQIDSRNGYIKKGAILRLTNEAAADLLADEEALSNLIKAMIRHAREIPEATAYPIFVAEIDTSDHVTLHEI